MATNYIGADVDSKMTDLAVERNQKIVQRYRVPTTITCLREVLGRIRGRKELAIEEGPMAHWLYRELRDFVDRIVICDPRRNAYIAKDGPLAKAGLTKESIITAAEGKPVAYLDDILAIVRSKQPGDQITLKVIEPIGKPQREVKVRLGKVKL